MTKRRGEELTDEQWELLEVLIPEPVRRPDGRGRPWRDNREVMDGILWILRSGARWQDLPERFPPYQTCHRRYQQWVRNGVLKDALEVLAQDLQERGGCGGRGLVSPVGHSGNWPRWPNSNQPLMRL